MASVETTPIKPMPTSPEANNNQSQLSNDNSLFYFELEDAIHANAPDANEDTAELINTDADFPSFEIVSAGSKSNYNKLRQRIQQVQDDVRGRYHVLKKRSVGLRSHKTNKKERSVSVAETPVTLIRHVKDIGTNVPGDSFRPRPFSADAGIGVTEGSITRHTGAGQRVLRDSVLTRGSESPEYIEINESDESTLRSDNLPLRLPQAELSYEHMRPESVSGDDDSSDIGWSDSEFDDSFASAEDEEDEGDQDGGTVTRVKDQELPDQEHATPAVKIVRLSDAGQEKTTLNTSAVYADGQVGIIRRLKDSFRSKDSVDGNDDKTFLPIRICEEKHPPPELPPLPADMSPDQLKRRHVLSSIVQSERSYILSLQRILEVYRDPLLEVPLLRRGKVHLIFTRVEEILQSHLMFQIELAEKVQTWHQDEKIGDVFFAAFYKSMVVESYSEYVNNFSAAMEDIKAVSRQQKPLSDFLTIQQTKSADRLSIFGLMVKPVQRFPQFIMLIQDMLKYTPEDHHDRLNLQRALTELEGVAFKLNERKRDSEQRLAAKQTLSNFKETWQTLAAKLGTEKVGRLLIRQDSFYQVSNQGGSLRYKQRRLFLMNDILLCANVERRERDGETVERYRLKWSAPLTDVDIKESAITSALQSSITGEAGSFCIVSPKLSEQSDDLFHLYSDLNELIHDYTVLGQTARLISSLKREYQGLSEELIHGIMRDMQRNIQMKDEQAHLVNSCSITIMLPVRGTVCKVIFQAPTPQCKDDWCLDLTVARLALDPRNTPSWDINSAGDQAICNNMPTLFMKSLQVDIPRYFTKIECAVPVYMSTTDNTHISVQHLWICANTDDHGHVSIVSIHRNRARVIESFTACDCQIVCVEMVSGYSVSTEDEKTKTRSEYEFADNTVWMGTDKGDVLIYALHSSDGLKREHITKFRLPCTPTALHYVDDQLFAALTNGYLAVIFRDEFGVWEVTYPHLIHLGSEPVLCLRPVKEKLLCTCGNKLHFINMDTLSVQKTVVLDNPGRGGIQSVVQCGVGLFVSYANSFLIQLYHLETMDHLQDINISSSLENTYSGKLYSENLRDASITCLQASKGMLWIGTKCGAVLTLPLPRLPEGVPQISCRPNVSYHTHSSEVKFLLPIYHKSVIRAVESDASDGKASRDGQVLGELDNLKTPNSITDSGELSREVFLPEMPGLNGVLPESRDSTIRRLYSDSDIDFSLDIEDDDAIYQSINSSEMNQVLDDRFANRCHAPEAERSQPKQSLTVVKSHDRAKTTLSDVIESDEKSDVSNSKLGVVEGVKKNHKFLTELNTTLANRAKKWKSTSNLTNDSVDVLYDSLMRDPDSAAIKPQSVIQQPSFHDYMTLAFGNDSASITSAFSKHKYRTLDPRISRRQFSKSCDERTTLSERYGSHLQKADAPAESIHSQVQSSQQLDQNSPCDSSADQNPVPPLKTPSQPNAGAQNSSVTSKLLDSLAPMIHTLSSISLTPDAPHTPKSSSNIAPTTTTTTTTASADSITTSPSVISHDASVHSTTSSHTPASYLQSRRISRLGSVIPNQVLPQSLSHSSSVIMVSGGNGHMDMTQTSGRYLRHGEAALLLWLYKANFS